jgi:hypothetical protein
MTAPMSRVRLHEDCRVCDVVGDPLPHGPVPRTFCWGEARAFGLNNLDRDPEPPGPSDWQELFVNGEQPDPARLPKAWRRR